MKRTPILLLALLVTALLAAPGPAVAHQQTQDQVAALDRMIAGRPLDAGLHMQRGEMHRMLGQRDAARRDYERSLRLDPGLAAVHLCEGRLWMDERLPERALAAVDRFITARPADAAGPTVRARALAMLGRHAQAAAAFGRAIVLEHAAGHPPQPDLYLEMARSLIAAGDDGHEKALAALEDGLARLARPVALEIEALSIERALGRTDAALARLDRLAASSARQEIWLVRRAGILEQAGRRAEAERAWRGAASAIDRLPASRRDSAVISELMSTVSAALRRLERSDPAPPGAP